MKCMVISISGAFLSFGFLARASNQVAANGEPLVTGPVCVNTVEEVPQELREHIPEDQTPVYQVNPPSSGQHYAVWARWQMYSEAVPRGYWVHNLEHGGVIFLYRPDASQDLIDALVRVFNAVPIDPACKHGRVILTPDPLLDVPWAVTASGPEGIEDLGVGYHIKSDCIESEQALVDFAVQHRNRAIEDVCADGDYPF